MDVLAIYNESLHNESGLGLEEVLAALASRGLGYSSAEVQKVREAQPWLAGGHVLGRQASLSHCLPRLKQHLSHARPSDTASPSPISLLLRRSSSSPTKGSCTRPLTTSISAARPNAPPPNHLGGEGVWLCSQMHYQQALSRPKRQCKEIENKRPWPRLGSDVTPSATSFSVKPTHKKH